MPQDLSLRFARFEGWGWDGALRGHARLFRPHPALACHLPHPGEGFFRLCKTFLFYFSILPKNRHYFSILPKNRRCFKLLRTTEGSLPPGGEGGAPAPDEGETGERTHVTHPTNTQRQASIPRPCPPPCHPERSGTACQESRAPTNHCRTANPAPSGAPAGGISIAERNRITLRTAQRSLSQRDKNSPVRPPSSVASRHLPPQRGRLPRSFREI